MGIGQGNRTCPIGFPGFAGPGWPWFALVAGILVLGARCPGDDDDTTVGPGDDDTSGDDDDTTGDDDTTAGDDDSAGDDDTTEPPEDPWPGFALGVTAAEDGLAPMYGATGVGWARLPDAVFRWGDIEPDPPDGGPHVYDWSCADALVTGYQTAGIADLQASLSPRSAWGSVSVDDSGADPPADGDVMPLPDRMDDYRAWVRATVERYDADGEDDMPGLTAPIRHWLVEREWSPAAWPSDDHLDYLTLAEATAGEARAAYPEVRLGNAPLLLWEVFEGNEPSDEEIDARLAGAPLAHNSVAGVEAILDRPDLFDFLAVQSRGDYTELPPTLRWLREGMVARGYVHPIWVTASPGVGPLAVADGFPALFPVTAEQQAAILTALADLAALEDPAATEARDWLDARTAVGLVHKAVTALGEGAVGVQLASTEDLLPDDDIPLRTAAVDRLGAAAAQGMLDVTHEGGLAPCVPRTPLGLRPAYRNLELLADKLGDGDFDICCTVGGLDGVRGYKFERAGYALYVLWWEDGVLELPGEVEIPQSYSLPLQCAEDEATVTVAVTEPAAPPPVPEQVSLEDDCSLYLELTSTPVFIELFAVSE